MVAYDHEKNRIPAECLAEVGSFLAYFGRRAEEQGEYLCFSYESHPGRPPNTDDEWYPPEELGPPTFDWGVGSPLASAWTDYVWLRRDGTVVTWNAEGLPDHAILEYRDLADYQSQMAENLWGTEA